MKPRHHSLLNAEDAVLLVIDVQEPFLRHIYDKEKLLANVMLLIRACRMLEVPIVATTQYAEKMGGLVPDVAELISSPFPTIDKLTFSAAAHYAFARDLAALDRRQVILCGVETHICIQQTALDLALLDYQVHCPADAVSSRTLEQHKLGMEKMRDCGIIPCASESAIMELLYQAGTDEFKSMLEWIK